MTIFQNACIESAFPDDDTVGDAEKFSVCELHARPSISIIQQHIDTRSVQLGIEGIRRLANAV